MKRTSQIGVERIRSSRRSRFNPLPGLNPQSLTSALEEFQAGNLRRAALFWDAMIRRDGILKSVVAKRTKGPARFPWEALTSQDSDRARQHAAALRWFYNNLTTTSALEPNERGGFPLLRRQMLSALPMRWAVHELVLRPRRANGVELPLGDDTEGTFRPDTLVTAEFRFCPLWWFEAREGPLRFLKTDFAYTGEDMKPGEWLVTGGDGLMEAGSVSDLYKRLSLKDWVGFNEGCRLQALDIATSHTPDSEGWEEARQAGEDLANGESIVRSKGETEIQLLESKLSAASLPFAQMVELMDRYQAILLMGGDLSTVSSKDGQGTGASLQGGASDMLAEDDAELLSETLNEQVDKPVLRYLFGEEPLAYVKILPPQRDDQKATIEAVEFLTGKGIAVGKSQVRERLGWPEPDEDDELVERAAAPETPPAPDLALENEATGAHELVLQSLAQDFAPLVARLKVIEAIEDADVQQAKLRELLADWDRLARSLTADPTAARALEQASAAELFNGLAERTGLGNEQPRDSLGRWADAGGGGLSEGDNIERGSKAADRALRQRADVQKAMFRKELGQIDFLWGTPGETAKDFAHGFGISHILAKHGEADVRALPRVLAKGRIKPNPRDPENKRLIEHDGYEVALVRKNSRSAWVLTGFKVEGR